MRNASPGQGPKADAGLLNFRLTVSYDGTRYYGWEHQPNTEMTIQGKLETVLTRMLEEEDAENREGPVTVIGAENRQGPVTVIGADVPQPQNSAVASENSSEVTGRPAHSPYKVTVIGAGRTDAGVHARAMTANVLLPTARTPLEIRQYMNRYLPDDISVDDVQIAGQRFHSRFHAVGKTYRYTLWYDPAGSVPVFERKYVTILNEKTAGGRPAAGKGAGRKTPGPPAASSGVPAGDVPAAAAAPEIAARGNRTPDSSAGPDLPRMREAAAHLVGTHDFKSFCGNSHMKKSTVRTVDSIRIEASGFHIYIDVHGDGFLQNMVRILAGTLLEVGYGRLAPEDMDRILEARDRRAAGPTLPPQGLCLMKVDY